MGLHVYYPYIHTNIQRKDKKNICLEEKDELKQKETTRLTETAQLLFEANTNSVKWNRNDKNLDTPIKTMKTSDKKEAAKRM